MTTLLNFVLGIIASMVAGVVLLGATALVSERARWVLTATLGRLLDIDVDYVFKSQRAAADDVKNEIMRAKEILLLTGRGNELQRETFADLYQAPPGRRQVRVLLPRTVVPPGEADWTAQREQELANFDTAYGTGILKHQIDTTAMFLEPHVKSGLLEMRRFDSPHLGRIMITDRCAYLTLYRRDAHGRDSCVIKYRRGGDTYEWLRRLFDQLWDPPTAKAD